MALQACNNKILKYDEACLTINNFQSNIIHLYNVSLECYKCAPQLFRKIMPLSTQSFIYSTIHPTILELRGQQFNYSATTTFEQHGHYGLNVSKNATNYYVISPPDDVYKPLKNALIFLTVAFILWAIGSCTSFYSHFLNFRRSATAREAPNDLGISRTDSTPLLSSPSATFESGRRNVSVDAFRGITITLMLFVNYGGGKYWFFQHAPWNGMTFADLVFPWFAWIMGLSIVLSITSQLRRSIPRMAIFKRIFLRSLTLIVIGIALNSFNKNNLSTLRLPGVLQRLGISYFIIATLETAFLRLPNVYNLTGRIRHMADVVDGWMQWGFIMMIISLHNYITFSIEIPNCPRGYLGPGGLHEYGIGVNCTGGIAGYIDRMIFSEQHMYTHPTTSKIYHSKQAFDPEGILGTLNTAFTVFLGACAGKILIYYNNLTGPPVRWMILSAICGTFALLFSNASQDDGIIPINKNLWSLSFVFATSSLAFFTLSILYMIIDYSVAWKGMPFVAAGRNSILLYIGSEITKKVIPWNWTPLNPYDHTQFLIMNIWSTVLWIFIAIILDNQGIYFKI